MFRSRLATLAAIFSLGFALSSAQASTMHLGDKFDDVATYGYPGMGRGPSNISLDYVEGDALATLTFDNSVTGPDCKRSNCKGPKNGMSIFNVFDGSNLISRITAFVKTGKKSGADILSLKVNYLKDGYVWTGVGKNYVCDNCEFVAELLRPSENVAPVPLPASALILGSGLLGLFGMRKFGRKAV